MNETCGICCETYNRSSRVKVNCPYCQYEACRECCETYLLAETVPKCMSSECGRIWTSTHLSQRMTTKFLNTKYKTHREELLFEREKALLPDTQPLVEEIVRKRKISKRIAEITHLIQDLNIQKHQAIYEYVTPPPTVAAFIRKCSAPECRGFLSAQWKCGLCENWTCPTCHEFKGTKKDTPHVCNPDMVATAALLAKDSKPCPGCKSIIFKISGCNQMWCTCCHVAFDWNTRRIETRIHNPHYFEWQRRNGGVVPRTEGDVPCGRQIHHNMFEQVYYSVRQRLDLVNGRIFGKVTDGVQLFARMVIHLTEVVLPRYEVLPLEQVNQQLRIDYLFKKITDDQFKTSLQRADKKYQKNTDIREIIQLAITTVTDVLFRLNHGMEEFVSKLPAFTGGHTQPNFDSKYSEFVIFKKMVSDLLLEIDAIITYCNELFSNINNVYKSKNLMYFNKQLILNTDMYADERI